LVKGKNESKVQMLHKTKTKNLFKNTNFKIIKEKK